MLPSVRPGPLNWVCFWRQTMARWKVSRPTIRAGTISTWRTKKRVMNSVLGNSPPKNRKAIHVPARGMARAIE